MRGRERGKALEGGGYAPFMTFAMERCRPLMGRTSSSGIPKVGRGRRSRGAAAAAAAAGGAAPLVGGAAAPPAEERGARSPLTNARMSSLVTRPSLPEPGTVARSILCSRAMRRTAGVANTCPSGSTRAGAEASAAPTEAAGAAATTSTASALGAASVVTGSSTSPSTSMSSKAEPVGAMSPTPKCTALITPL